MKKIFIFSILGIFLLGLVSAGAYANFFYSEKCSHCAKVFPLVKDLSNKFDIRFYNVDEGSYNVLGVPTIIIDTSDDREIILVGSEEIQLYLGCELNEMSTLDCPTYSVSEGYNCETQSWFIR